MKLKVLQLLVNADGPEKMERSNSFMDQDDCTLPISSPNITKWQQATKKFHLKWDCKQTVDLSTHDI